MPLIEDSPRASHWASCSVVFLPLLRTLEGRQSEHCPHFTDKKAEAWKISNSSKDGTSSVCSQSLHCPFTMLLHAVGSTGEWVPSSVLPPGRLVGIHETCFPSKKLFRALRVGKTERRCAPEPQSTQHHSVRGCQTGEQDD